MQGGRDPFFGFGDPFGNSNGFGGFGGPRSMLSGFFGGRDPFDDPFFTRRGSLFGSSFFGSNGSPFMNLPIGGPFMDLPSGGPFMNENSSGFLDHQPSMSNKSKGPVIEELTSGDEKDENESEEQKKVNPRKHGRSSKEPIVDDPDDEANEKKGKYMAHKNNINLLNHGRPRPQTQSFTFQSSTVTYGGANGAYYTSSSTKRAGSDGLSLEEFKEANSSTGQATHRVSRGIHEKGHSMTRKLKSDGHVDTMQTLHNLNEDELFGFEEAWSGNAKKHLPGWSEKLALQDTMASGSTQLPQNRGGWALPSTERSSNVRSLKPDNGRGAGLPHQMKKRANDGTGSSRYRSNETNRH
ncbi:uncharacterized protein [Primulina huaijiensis]|uniref:uncharacterized protein n=1 Tax=Primulina huaijiensis TaxID=1492673 RepID=UPI003CC7766B